ncbi:PRC-barrel domain-containing protein [Oculatella sp. LEGE 06141]|uniref:PRC-barrel domain-containing protein n=1 Tax=Oculatella sp. LEGE 06141 TaxID=1828648 RepID=UPI001881822D|nr:PRC-barrel domain-containing protein [Oculatella sp. LEGE 06141]MBE9181571.1 PRC-barrel domain-containing protein [Oculatella sp. LEGE 06141]
MALLRFEDFVRNNREASDSNNIQGFDVYGDRDEKIGKIVDILIDDTNRFQYLVVNLSSWIAGKQVLLPLTSHQVDPNRHRIYVHGLTKSHATEMPAYNKNVTAAHNRESTRTDYHYPGSIETSAPLETSLPLDTPRVVDIPEVNTQSAPVPETRPTVVPLSQVPPQQPLNAPTQPVVERSQVAPTFPEPTADRVMPEATYQPARRSEPVSPAPVPKTTVEETIQLLEERLVVHPNKRKIGEVVVRKEIETRIVEVPIRREKLIVEQVSPEYKTLAIVDLGDKDGVEKDRLERELSNAANLNARPTVSNKFTSARAASQYLEEIANQPNAGSEQVQVTIVLQDPEQQSTYDRQPIDRI